MSGVHHSTYEDDVRSTAARGRPFDPCGHCRAGDHDWCPVIGCICYCNDGWN